MKNEQKIGADLGQNAANFGKNGGENGANFSENPAACAEQNAQKQGRIVEMFNAIAPTYDRANAILSFGIDNSWRKAAAAAVLDAFERDFCAGGASGDEYGGGRGANSNLNENDEQIRICTADTPSKNAANSPAQNVRAGEKNTPKSISFTRDFPPLNIADIACGTGDMMLVWREAIVSRKLTLAKLVGIDPSTQMLEVARAKLTPQTSLPQPNLPQTNSPQPAHTTQNTAQTTPNSNLAQNGANADDAECANAIKTNELAANQVAAQAPAANKVAAHRHAAQIHLINAFADETGCESGAFDAVSITYGIRNVVELDAALAEFHRILRRGGRLVVLEFTRRDKRGIVARLRDFYLAKILPLLGGAISKNRAAYEYLPSSIEGFLDAGEFCERLKKAGFEVEICKGFSFNVSTMFIAKKP